MSQITLRHLLDLKVKHAAATPTEVQAAQDNYAHGFIKACRSKQVDPAKLIEIAETLDIHL